MALTRANTAQVPRALLPLALVAVAAFIWLLYEVHESEARLPPP